MNRRFEDDWGQDPSVQNMRRLFSSMEEAQQRLLREMNISLLDPRLRRLREQALECYEQAWPLAVKKEIILSEKDAASFYLHCLARAIKLARVEVPKELLPNDEKMIRFLQEERS